MHQKTVYAVCLVTPVRAWNSARNTCSLLGISRFCQSCLLVAFLPHLPEILLRIGRKVVHLAHVPSGPLVQGLLERGGGVPGSVVSHRVFWQGPHCLGTPPPLSSRPCCESESFLVSSVSGQAGRTSVVKDGERLSGGRVLSD